MITAAPGKTGGAVDEEGVAGREPSPKVHRRRRTHADADGGRVVPLGFSSAESGALRVVELGAPVTSRGVAIS